MTGEPAAWPRLGDDPSLIGPPDWLMWDDAFRRLCKRPATTSEDARDVLRDLVRRRRSAFVQVNSSGEETDVRFFPGTISGPVDADQVEPRVVIDAHGVEHIVPYQIYRPPIGSGCPDYSDGHTTFWVLTADIEKEERPYLMTAAPTAAPPHSPTPQIAPSEQQPPGRRGWKRRLAEEGVKATFPNGEHKALSTGQIIGQVCNWLKKNYPSEAGQISEDTIRKAAGRK